MFAQCRPTVQHQKAGKCFDDDDWQCPQSWMAIVPHYTAVPRPHLEVHVAHACTDPTPKFGNCFESLCCEDKRFGCFKRDGVEYAQCRPSVSKTCTDTDDWLCPSSWITPAGKPTKPLSHTPASNAAVRATDVPSDVPASRSECTVQYGDCSTSTCCQSLNE
jgi:hypothetical protein